MDFDDLDEATEARIADGEEVLGLVKLNNQAPRGTVLEPMKRTKKLPSDVRLPQDIRDRLPQGKEVVERTIKLRVLIFYGAGDSVMSGWAQMHHDAPTELELATFETPGHGIRKDDQLRKTLNDVVDDAFEACREAMDTAAFAVIGHSIGCLIATAVAERAKRELNVEPVYAIMLERGAPHHAVLSRLGQEQLRNDLGNFLDWYGGFVGKVYRSGTKDGLYGGKMWQHDMELENDTREVGWFKFSCPILSVCALKNFWVDPDAELDPQTRASVDFQCGMKVSGKPWNFDKSMYKDWQQWTTHPDGCTVLEVDTDHFGVKVHPAVRKAMWEVLRKAAA